MNKFELYITAIFIVKISLIGLILFHMFVKYMKPEYKELLEKIEFWKKRFEFIFNIMMSFLLTILFNPHKHDEIVITGQVKLLLYLFGLLMLVSADWNIFIHESPIFVTIQKIVKN